MRDNRTDCVGGSPSLEAMRKIGRSLGTGARDRTYTIGSG